MKNIFKDLEADLYKLDRELGKQRRNRELRKLFYIGTALLLASTWASMAYQAFGH